ncbi:MAG: hypothetical protein DMG11_31620 [Acidobacteria bacterium]|nr:MAG: hypothetical protein DMG11_31620 [Acidobacteriota bacterium]
MNAILLLSLVLLFSQAAPVGALLEGSLVKLGTREPVRGRILLTKTDGSLNDSRTAVADDNGKFVIGNILPGNYRLFADGENYVRAEYGSAIALASGQEMRNVVVTMTPTGVTVGRVLNRPGDPLTNIYVRALKPAYRQGERSFTAVRQAQLYFISVAPYDLPRIESQTYIVPTPPCLDCRGEGQAEMSLVRLLATGDFIDPRAVEGAVSLPVYFPGTTDPATARPIVLEAGTMFNAGDFIAVATRGVTVRGRIIDYLNGQMVAGASIQLDTRPRASGSVSLRSVRPDPNNPGAFEIAGLVPGSYILTSKLGDDLAATTALEVRDRDIENLDIVLRPLFKVTGRLAGGNVAGLTQTRILLQPQLGGIMTPQSAVVQLDGTFTISSVVAGDYRIAMAGAPKSWYMKTARLGTTDVLDRVVRLEGEPKSHLEVLISGNGATLDVIVRDDQQRPVPQAMVILAAAKSLALTATTDPSGRAHMEGIVPGAYKVFAPGNREGEGIWQDPDVLGLYENRGLEIRFTEGGNQNVELTVISE